MIVKDVINCIEGWSPLHYAEDFDNVGLLTGAPEQEVIGILVTLDTLENVVDEAIAKNCNLIVSFHPIIFKGLKKINGKNYVERVVIKAIQNNMSIFCMHTALDNHWQGVNYMITEKLGLQNQQILIPKKHSICKLNTFVPQTHLQKVQEALFAIGGGTIGNYDHCSFTSTGTGSFKGNEHAKPTAGKVNELELTEEIQLQMTFPSHLTSKITNTLKKTHPYEEVAYEITSLENSNQKIGMGMIGDLAEPMEEKACLAWIKKTFKSGCVRHSALLQKKVTKIAVLGGSGAFAIPNAQAAGADIFITGDVKYHEFFMAENKMIIADIGHYESEQYTKNLIVSHLRKKISNFAPAFNLGNVILSAIDTNPITYF